MGVRDLRADLANAVRRAEAGEEIVVTLSGRPVARLVALGAASGGPTLDDLVAAGAVVPPRRSHRPARPAPLDVPVDARTDRALREIR